MDLLQCRSITDGLPINTNHETYLQLVQICVNFCTTYPLSVTFLYKVYSVPQLNVHTALGKKGQRSVSVPYR
jgi:hypothetical protein